MVGIWPHGPIRYEIWLTQEDYHVISVKRFCIALEAMLIGSFSGRLIKLLWMAVTRETAI
jgi:hypothetical protein